MLQSILVGLIFIIAMIYLGRFLYRQINAGKTGSGHCDKCLPDVSSKRLKEGTDGN